MPDLVRYSAMCKAIAAAYKVDEVKDIRDKAVALEHYSKQAHNTEAERQACEIRLRAERKAAEIERKQGKDKGGRPKKNLRGRTAGLRAHGVSRDQAEQWRKLAAVPEKDFERALADRTTKPTTSGIIRAAAEPKQKPIKDEALWLWGRLRDFDRNYLDKDPREVLESLTASMKDDVHTLAPRVAAWLKRIGAQAS